MIDYHQFCQIKDLHEREGLKAAQIAGVLGLDPRTPTGWVKTASGLEKSHLAPVNSTRSRPRFDRCLRST